MRAIGTGLIFILFTSACVTNLDGGDDDGVDVSADTASVKITPMRGADRAGELSVTEAKRLKNDHGVKWTGVYIGGPCNGGFGWTKAGVTAIANATGWRFAPIYVGRQEAAICGRDNLTASQGKADAKDAVADMKRFGWQPNKDIPIFLDLEAGTYFAHPTASTSYVRAWVDEVHGLGYRADVYSTPDGLDTFHDKHLKIDGVWAASYFYRGFESVVPADLDQMGGRYRHRNRAWQYAGDFDVSGVGDVDADTANMLLAPKPGGTNRATTSHREVPATCGELQPTEGLAAGESLTSCDGTVTLSLGTDGVLALEANDKLVWTAPTGGGLGATAVLEDNGELAVFDADENPIYTAGTGGYSDAHLELHADGLALVDDDATTLWTSAAGLQVGELESLSDAMPGDAGALP